MLEMLAISESVGSLYLLSILDISLASIAHKVENSFVCKLLFCLKSLIYLPIFILSIAMCIS